MSEEALPSTAQRHGARKWDLNFFRAKFQSYQDRYHSESYTGMTNYVAWVERIFEGGLK